PDPCPWRPRRRHDSLSPSPVPPLRSGSHAMIRPRPRPILLSLAVLALPLASGCSGENSPPELVWGRKGVQDGDFVRPRAIAIDAQDRLYIVDFTARIQAYDRARKYLPHHTRATPDYRDALPILPSID